MPRDTGLYKDGVPVQVQSLNGGNSENTSSHNIGLSTTQDVEVVQPGAQGAQVAFFPGPEVTSQLQLSPGFRHCLLPS